MWLDLIDTRHNVIGGLAVIVVSKLSINIHNCACQLQFCTIEFSKVFK